MLALGGVEGVYYFVCVLSIPSLLVSCRGDPFLCPFDNLNRQQMVHQKRLHNQRYTDYLKGTPEQLKAKRKHMVEIDENDPGESSKTAVGNKRHTSDMWKKYVSTFGSVEATPFSKGCLR